jgi:Rieske Fe-S protein
MGPVLSRRGVLAGCGGLCALAVTGCTSYGAENYAPSTGSAASPKQKLVVPTADIPVGSGKIYPDAQVVITQPTAGVFKAFSAVCTHAGCTVDNVTTTINCICHGSMYSITDGSVVHDPATQPLPAYRASVSGGKVTVG